MEMFTLLRIIILGFGPLLIASAENTYTVTTNVGDIIGTTQPVTDDQIVTKFLGIPFAESTAGNLRFRKPVKKARFNTPFNATRVGESCSQIVYAPLGDETPSEKSEDCLLLNVYVPYNMTSSSGSQNRKSVMIWIYGGGFIVGESNTYDGSFLSTSGDVIVVTINYRLGLLGFLSSGDSSLPGNLGLWDQHMGIQWVHDHIDRFGGDPNSVTIFGESAGSASVVHQCFYPGNRGLFHRAIAQSGSSSSGFAWNEPQIGAMNFNFLAEQFSCSGSNSDIVECLRQVPVAQLMAILQPPAPVTPVTDGEFILDSPSNFMNGLSSAQEAYDMFYSVDLMIGYTNADGLVDIVNAMALLGMSPEDDFHLTKSGWEDVLIPFYLGYSMGTGYNKYAEMLTINEYTDWRDPTSAAHRGQQFVHFLTNYLFLMPTVQTADLHSSTAASTSTYVYEFSVRPIKHAIDVPASLDGDDVMNHADDIIFLFGDQIDQAITDPKYYYLLNTYRATMTLWTNFAKSGNPNSPTSVTNIINTTWPEYTSTSKQFINLTVEMSPESIKSSPNPRAVNFWSNVIPGLAQASIPNNISEESTTVRVTTPVGEIIGTESYVPYNEDCGFRVQSYMGIPFAKPQTGNLRFQKPVAKEPFTEPFNATQPGPSCYQVEVPGLGTDAGYTMTMSEDCLILNVYVPKLGNGPVTNKSVMVWIYGGGFSLGEINFYDPKVLAGYSDVIVVSINYRVGQFGFLTTGDGVIPSNIGLWDQHMGLQWVHDNIVAFGGDVNRITIFGESAGAASVIFQTYYPGNRGLFQRAISQSGSINSPWAMTDIQRAIQNTRDFSRLTDCPLTSTRRFLECLQSKPISDLHDAMTNMSSPTTLPIQDNDFILDAAANLISGQTTAASAIDMFNSVDLLIGYTSADGLSFANYFPYWLGQPDFKTMTLPRAGYEEILVPQLLNLTSISDATDEALDAVVHDYTDWSDPESEIKRARQLKELYTDYLFAISSLQTANRHAAGTSPSSTYVYQFSVRPYKQLFDLPIPDLFNEPGVANHGDEIAYVMGNFITNITATEELHQQLRVYLATMTMWSNFAKSGNPNSPADVTKYLYTTWPEYTSSKLYLDIEETITQNAVKHYPKQQAINFWETIFPQAKRTSKLANNCETSSATSNRVSAVLGMLLVFVFFMAV